MTAMQKTRDKEQNEGRDVVKRQGDKGGLGIRAHGAFGHQPPLLRVRDDALMVQHRALAAARGAAGILIKRRVGRRDISGVRSDIRGRCGPAAFGEGLFHRNGRGLHRGDDLFHALHDEIHKRPLRCGKEFEKRQGHHVLDRRLVDDGIHLVAKEVDDHQNLGGAVGQLMFQLGHGI